MSREIVLHALIVPKLASVVLSPQGTQGYYITATIAREEVRPSLDTILEVDYPSLGGVHEARAGLAIQVTNDVIVQVLMLLAVIARPSLQCANAQVLPELNTSDAGR